ncbi:MAG: membrane lipoprotein lipid attachment site-containing protein [Rikenellaceae bacterium]|nr:membrane lipoprotein lipid attachment site-containing protein [Rikenellaceae bacterium]
MKRLIYLIVALIALSSCTVSEGWDPKPDYVAQKAYGLAIQEVHQQIHILSYAQTVDYYSRSGDGEREIIEDHHLLNTRLRQTDEGWDVIQDGNLAFTFIGNTPLGEVGSVWNVKVAHVFYSYNGVLTTNQYWTIECTGENRWKVRQSATYESHSSEVAFDIVAGDQLEAQLENSPIYKYTVEGECAIVQDEKVVAPYRIDMKIMEPVVFDNYNYYSNYKGTTYTEGKMSIRVTDYSTGEWVTTPFHYTIAPERSNIKIEYLLIN